MTEEQHAWGTRIIVYPLPGLNMQISADITLPKPGRSPEIKLYFSGVTPGKQVSFMESVAWGNGLEAVQARAREIASEMKGGKKPPKPPPKSPKKKR